MEQTFWREGECTAAMLLRSAFTSKAGLVDPAEVALALGAPPQSPELPDWVKAWIAADAERPWPPQV